MSEQPSTPEQGSEREQRVYDEWLQAATQFFVLTNSGAAIAVLSFIGTSLDTGSFPKLAVVSLFCFVAALIIAGLAILGQTTGAYRALLTATIGFAAADVSINRINRNWMTRWTDKYVEPRTGSFLVAALALFIVGAAIGLAALALW